MLFVNPKSGGGKAARVGLVELAQERGIEAVILPEHDVARLVADVVADGADALGVAGGDGSLAVVASVAPTHGLPFVCVPAGTRNYFALDLGVDRRDLVGALDAFTDGGIERSIDVAEVNGRVFLNNVSIGIYGDAVGKTQYRDAKVRTLLETTVEVLGPGRAVSDLRIVDDLGREHRHPAVVLVSNNPYALERRIAPGTRPRLDGGQLGIIVLDGPSARSGGRAWRARELAVDATPPVRAGIDGEAVELDAPLGFAIRPRALRVRISSRHPGSSRSGRLP